MRSTNPEKEERRTKFNEVSENAAIAEMLDSSARDLFACVVVQDYGTAYNKCELLLRKLGEELGLHVETRSYKE